jgi:hypothetical protein
MRTFHICGSWKKMGCGKRREVGYLYPDMAHFGPFHVQTQISMQKLDVMPQIFLDPHMY